MQHWCEPPQLGFRGFFSANIARSRYAFFESAVPTNEKFMQQMDALTREVGDRGKAKVSEGVPPKAPAPVPAKPTAPAFEPTPEPGPARAPMPSAYVPTTPAKAVAPVSTPDYGFSPSMQLSPSMPMVHQHASGPIAGGSLSEMSLFFKEQREEARVERAELQAKMDAKDVKMEQQRQEM